MTTANTFHDPTTRLLVDDALEDGPIKDVDELSDRGMIAVHNLLGRIFAATIEDLSAAPSLHPETRQVTARAAQMIDDLGREFRPS